MRAQEALIELMSLPDEPKMMRPEPRRTRAGFHESNGVKHLLALAYLSHRRQDHDDISCVVSVNGRARS